MPQFGHHRAEKNGTAYRRQRIFRVITASNPYARTASATASVSVATATRPRSASAARAATCTIIGLPEAQFQYALILIDGRQVKKDEKKAQVLLQAAAEAGNPLAQFNLAQLLLEQDPGEAGLTRAVLYYQKAAETGLADAQYAMAQIYANGAGGKTKDDTEARKLLVLAAQQNYDTAQLDLGQWLIDGRGGKRDLKSGAKAKRR